MKRLIKLISIMLAIAYLLLIPLNSLAAAGAVSANVTDPLLNKWQGYGLVDKSLTNSDLNKAVQKIDFISLINGIMKPTNKANISFSDVPGGTWYGDEISKAAAAGYIDNKDKAKFNPFSEITRLEAAIMVKRVFGLELKDKRLLSKITDAEAVEGKQLEEFAAVIEKGCLTQVAEGRYVPYGVLKLSDALNMLDICVGQVVTKSGTVSDNVSGNMMINTGAVTLKDMNVAGDLTVGEGAGDGDVRLDGVSVNGKLIIRGGGPNSVTLTNTRINDILVIEKSAGNVRVKTFGTTTIDKTYIKSGCILEESGLTSGQGFVDVTAERSAVENQKIDLKGNYNKLTVNESNLDVNLNGNADAIDISKGAAGNLTISAGNVKTITTKASQNIIEILGGTVTTLNIDTGAIGNKLTVNGTATVSNVNVKENTDISLLKGTVDKLILESASEGSKLNISSGAYLKNITANAAVTISGSGSITNAYIYAPNVSMSIRPSGDYIRSGTETTPGGTVTDPTLPKITISNVYNRTIMVGSNNQKLDARASNGAEIFYSSADNSIVTVGEKGQLNGVSVGTTNVYISAVKEGYAPAISTITINVISGNTTSTGTLSVSPSGGTAGEIIDLVITYTAAENMTSGRIVFKLPAGFTASESDTFSINSGAETALTKVHLIDPGTLSFNNIALASDDTIQVTLKKKEVPAGGQLEFAAVVDADGMGPKVPAELSAIFTCDSLKILQGNGVNYSTPEYGSVTGTTKISKLSSIGIPGATGWIISDVLTPPVYDQVLTGTAYSAGQDIQAAAGQQIMLAAVDAANKVKGYAVITIDASMIRPDDATTLDPAAINVEPGIQAGSVRLNGLDSVAVPGASAWMIKLQNAPSPAILIDSVFDGTVKYIPGDDIKVSNNQYIVLAAVDNETSKHVKAYVSIPVAGKVSQPAGALVEGINYSKPANGSTVGTISIQSLTPGEYGISDWQYVILDNPAVIPAINVVTSEFKKYTGNQEFKTYNAKENILVDDGKHILLVGTKDADSKILAYADILVESGTVRREDAAAIPPSNIVGPVMGSTAGTISITTNFSTPIAGAAKYKYRFQNTKLEPAPQINSKSDIYSELEKDLKVTGKYLVLVATDNSGLIKAYMNIEVDENLARPDNAYLLRTANNDYSIVPGTTSGAISVNLAAAKIENDTGKSIFQWWYKLANSDFGIPYTGSDITGSMTAVYTPGNNILNVAPKQYLMIIAVDDDGKTVAYLKEQIQYNQIKQADAGTLLSSAEDSVNFNYSVPEPGDKGGQTKIRTLGFWGYNGGNSWKYTISAAPVAVPAKFSSASGLNGYAAQYSVTVDAGKYLVLYLVDNQNQILAFKNIKISADQIRPQDAKILTSVNYSAPVPGTTAGAIAISYLSFRDLDSSADYTGWTWRYVVGNSIFSPPAMGTDINSISGTQVLTTTTNIQVKPKQYVLLLAVDKNGFIKGYANILINQEAINPGNAEQISTDNYHLTKGTVEGTTSFDKLITVGLDSQASKWMIKVQAGPFASTMAKNTKVSGASWYPYNGTDRNIPVNVGDHILLLATDTSGYVKAFADITVNSDVIQAPFAKQLKLNEDYTVPAPGNAAGTVRMALQETNIPKASGETIVWKYKKSVYGYKAHFDDDSSGSEFTVCKTNEDMKVEPGYWLLAATIGDKIKAYAVINIDASQIKPSEAPLLEIGKNYAAPAPGSQPGTTKITGLTYMNVTGSENCVWQIKVANTNEVIMANSRFMSPDISNYTSGDITVMLNQYIILAAVDKTSGIVRAYKTIKVEEGTVNAPALTAGVNYTALKPGTVLQTTSLYVAPDITKYVVRLVDSAQNITAGSTINYAAAPGAGYDYSNYSVYISGSNIKAEVGKYILVVAVDSAGKALAYQNIQVVESSLRKGDATLLKTPQNYSDLEAGTGINTVKIAFLDFFGLPTGEKEWAFKVQSTTPAAVEMDSIIQVTTQNSYVAGKDIFADEGEYVILYAVEKATGKVKGYAVLEVKPGIVRGVAPLLQYSGQVLKPGSDLNTTKIDEALITKPTGANVIKYIVRSSAIGTVLKDSPSADWNVYTTGSDIQALEGQHLILAATDGSGLIKAYADITINGSTDLRSIIASLGGSLITSPVDATRIATGGETITITLDSAEWADDAVTTKTSLLLGGFKASGTATEAAKWTAVMNNVTLVEKVNNKTIQIKLSEVAYDITANQEITLTIPAELVKGAVKPVAANNTITIAAASSVVITLKSPANADVASFSQGDIKAGSFKIVITLKGGKFASDVDTNAVKRDAIFNGLKATYNIAAWTDVINALVSAGKTAINLNSENKITITLQAVDYKPLGNEVITVTVPYKTSSGEPIIAGAVNDAAAASKITIYSDISAVLSGTLVSAPVAEPDIVAGGKTLVVTLTDGKWVSDIVSNETARNALFAGLTVSPVVSTKDTEAWTKKAIPALQAAAKLTGQTVITRTSDTVIEITMPPVTGYEIGADQSIVLNLPSACIAGGIKDKLSAPQSIKITNVAPAVAAAVKDVSISGTVYKFKTDDTITINVEFDTAVDVSGTPVINLNTNRDAVYKTKTAANILTFEYKVQAGDAASKLDYKKTNSLVLPTGTTIVNSGTSVSAKITLPAPGKTGSLGDPLKTPIVVDTAAPKYAASYPKKGTIEKESATVLVKTGEAANIYYVVVPGGSTPPSADQVVDEAKGTVPPTSIDSGITAVAANTEGTLSISGLSENTNYSVYIIAEDMPGNRAAVTKFDFTTTDGTPPVFDSGYPKQKTPLSDNKIEIEIKINEPGTACLIALPVGADEPTREQVLEYKNASGVTVAGNLKATGTIPATGEVTLTLTGLTVSSHYDIYVVCKDLAGNLTAPAMIPAETSMLNLKVVAVDLSKKQLSNTTGLMEYSLDGTDWKDCSNGTTTFTFDDDAADLTIYVQEKANPAINKEQLGVFLKADKNIIDLGLISYNVAQGKIYNASAINLQFRINGGAWAALNASVSGVPGSAAVTFVPGKLEVRTAVTQTKLPSLPKEVDNIPGQEAAPNVSVEDDTNVITGLLGIHEYRIGTGNWIDGSIKSDLSGTKDVEVRKKATSRALPSNSKMLHFTAGSIKVAAAPETATGKKTVTITFEENTNKQTITNIANWLLVGAGDINTGIITTPHSWGTDFTAAWTSANTITLVYNTMTGATMKIGDVVKITADGKIQNAAGNSGFYSVKGKLTGSFNTVPSIVDIKAMNTGNQEGLGNGDSIVITFDQPVKEGIPPLDKDNISTFLTVKDRNGIKKASPWAAVTANTSIQWDATHTVLTIIFDNVPVTPPTPLISASDKIIVETAWKLTDADGTTEYCNASLLITGSFTSAPEITDVDITSDGTAGLSAGDTVKITFSQPTDKKVITQALLRSYFKILSSDKKTTHSWGYQDESGISWNGDGTVLTIKISNTTGVTLASNDWLTLDASADIMDADGGIQAVGKDIMVKGSF